MTSASQGALPEGTEHEVDQILRDDAVPGCAVAVVDRSGLRGALALGVADVRTGRPVTPNTRFNLFSGTKLFTALAVMQLVEDGRLDPSDSVADHLVEVKGLEGLNVAHLLTHTSGLKDTLRAFMSFRFEGEPWPSTADALALYRIRRTRAPGSVAYGNVNYALLGEIVSRLSGTPFVDHLRARVLSPLGTGADFDEAVPFPDRAVGYMGRWDPMRLVLRVVVPEVARRLVTGRVAGRLELRHCVASPPIGGLSGSALDFAPFLVAQLNSGGGLLSEAGVVRMQTMHAEGAAGIESRAGIGFGWKFGTSAAGPFINHEGGGPGFTSELRLYPERGIGIVLLMNTMRMPSTMRTAHAICSRIARRC